jgi:hypothetical protein
MQGLQQAPYCLSTWITRDLNDAGHDTVTIIAARGERNHVRAKTPWQQVNDEFVLMLEG